MTSRPSALPPPSGPRPARNVRVDLVFLTVGMLIVAVTWPAFKELPRRAPISESLPFLTGALLVARGVMGRWPTGDVTRHSARVGAVIIAVLLFLCWWQLAG